MVNMHISSEGRLSGSQAVQQELRLFPGVCVVNAERAPNSFRSQRFGGIVGRDA